MSYIENANAPRWNRTARTKQAGLNKLAKPLAADSFQPDIREHQLQVTGHFTHPRLALPLGAMQPFGIRKGGAPSIKKTADKKLGDEHGVPRFNGACTRLGSRQSAMQDTANLTL